MRCTEDHPCDKYNVETVPSRTAAKALSSNGVRSTVRDVPGVGKVAVVSNPQRSATASNGSNPSLPMAKAAKERLEAVGWACQGRAWIDAGEGYASVTASRGEETLIMEWVESKVIRQDYSMNSPNPDKNGIPPHKLNFDPEEVTDSELARMISGMKVTWWNTLAGSTETAVIGNRVQIEHIFVGGGDVDNSKRIVKFLDHSGGGFRAFHAGALLKVG